MIKKLRQLYSFLLHMVSNIFEIQPPNFIEDGAVNLAKATTCVISLFT